MPMIIANRELSESFI